MILNITTTKPMEKINQTAVEWMFDKLLEEGPSGELRWHLKYDIFKIFEQAKEMEKEQIMQAVYDSMGTNFDPNMGRAEMYYNEKYGK